jgi:hypothetical protein
MNALFCKTCYHITAPDRSWRETGDSVVCSKCNEALFFVFHTDAARSGFASSYQVPTAVRCGCFAAERNAGTKRAPIPIEPLNAK